MNRLVIMTIGKTHSGKSTFANRLARRLDAIVVDQDHHAEFLNTHYRKLVPDTGPNTLKHALTQWIVAEAKQTRHHLIVCNANLSRRGRKALLEETYPASEFVRILVHFDLPDEVLSERIASSERTTTAIRGAINGFAEVLSHQTVDFPSSDEADHLWTIRDAEDIPAVIEAIERTARQPIADGTNRQSPLYP